MRYFFIKNFVFLFFFREKHYKVLERKGLCLLAVTR